MADILDYVLWRGDLSVREREINVVDVLVMSQFALLDLNGIVGEEGVSFEDMRDKMYEIGRESVSVGLLAPRDMLGLLNVTADSKRFSDVILHDRIEITDESKDMQITALTADFPANKARMVIFSGTGDTIVAWKEDFDLMYKEVPSQKVATEYLEKMAKDHKGDLYVCGHSKGGHLTLYSAVNCDEKTQRKITAAYSFDGPGLSESGVEKLASCPIYEKIFNIIPEGSIVGRLFCHKEQIKVVKSDNIGLIQHDAFNWHVTRDDMVYSEKNLDYSNEISALTKSIIDGMDDEKRAEFTEAFYKVLFGSGATTLTELMSKGRETLDAYIRLSPQEKNVLLEIASKLFGDKTVRKLFAENIKSSLHGSDIKGKLREALKESSENFRETLRESRENREMRKHALMSKKSDEESGTDDEQ